MGFNFNTKGGLIGYQSISSPSNDLDNITNEINRLTHTKFSCKNAFIITYDKVRDYKTGKKIVTFQIILSTDDSLNSFVTLKYTDCLTPYLTYPGIYCVNKKGLLVKIPIGDPCSSSNVNIKGTWIFDVTNECKC